MCIDVRNSELRCLIRRKLDAPQRLESIVEKDEGVALLGRAVGEAKSIADVSKQLPLREP